jgi:tripeptide aminopeptidase
MKLLALPGPSGRESLVADYLRKAFVAAGVAEKAIVHDRANKALAKKGKDFEIGNLIAKIPGRGKLRREPRLLFMGHMDTVPLCRGAVPKRIRLDNEDRIVPAGKTALGGDNRTSLGALITLVETLAERDAAHPPLTILCTVGEEIGLLGAKHVQASLLGKPVMGFNVDAGQPAAVTIGAVGADRFSIEVHGKSSHAGVHPEHGISAVLIASRAIADIAQKGYFGKIDLGAKQQGTSNIGVIEGGETTNQVTDLVRLRGESRSHNKSFLSRITREIKLSFQEAARSVTDHEGATGSVRFEAARDYDSFRMPKGSPPVKRALQAADELGLPSALRIANGGLDANILNGMGIPTVTLGAGQHNPHTVDEYVAVQEYLDGCRLLAAIASGV